MVSAKRKLPASPELIQTAEALAAPIDFQQLIADGVLEKAGRWFEVLDPSRLPEHARGKIKALKTGNRVKFREPSKRLKKFLRDLEAAEPNGQPETNGTNGHNGHGKKKREKAGK